MIQFELRPFETMMLAEAGVLLAQRHLRDRVAAPLLPQRFEDPQVATEAVAATWQRDHCSGYTAFQHGHMIGFLIGDRVVDAQRGRHVWMRLPGHALADGVDAELYRDLYAAAGREWLETGHFDHFVLLNAGDRDTVEAFFNLSFGKEQEHALCDLAALTVPPAGGGPWAIRQATSDDRTKLVEAAEWIPRRLAQAPVWGAALPERLEDRAEQYAAIVDDETATAWLAEEDGRLLGVSVFYSEVPVNDDLVIGEECAYLAVGATRPDERERGVATALTWTGLEELKAHGFQTCIADWRVTNLEASRFWPRFGFETVVVRLARRVDERVSWAR